MKIKITRLIFFVLVIATFIVIFIFSNENGEQSSSTSRGFVKTIIEMIPTIKNLDDQQKQEIIENSQTVIRKLAHFSIYTLLGINLMGFISTYDKLNIKINFLISLGIGVLYAVSDEIHQMFSGGRTPAIKDVCIDTLGVVFGILILLGVYEINKIFKIKNKTKNSIKK